MTREKSMADHVNEMKLTDAALLMLLIDSHAPSEAGPDEGKDGGRGARRQSALQSHGNHAREDRGGGPVTRQERAWTKRLQITQGCARKLRASVLYVSPDGRAVVWSYDSSTKYLNASMFWADSENEIGVTLFRSESTLRASRSKKPAEVRLKLPKGPKGSWWLFSLSAGRYDGVIHMWRYDPEETREHR